MFLQDMLSVQQIGAESEERPQVVCSRAGGETGELDLEERRKR